MNTIPSIPRPALIALLSLSLGAATAPIRAQEPREAKEPSAAEVESSDPFSKAVAEIDSKSPKLQSAEMLDAQARILFARGETERAIAIQLQAVKKAKDNVEKFSETLARYEGRPLDGPIARKLSQIIIPVVDFEDTSILEALDYLRVRAAELDSQEQNEEKRGVNFVTNRIVPHPDPAADPNLPQPEIPRIKELRLTNVPLGEVLRYICEATGTSYKIEAYAVNLVPAARP